MNEILVQMLHFVDDIAMIADSEENLERMLISLDKTLKHDYNIKINLAKTKILVCSKQHIDTNITINIIRLERVNSFIYLRSKISSDGKNTTNINCRVMLAKQVFFKNKKTIHHNNSRH